MGSGKTTIGRKLEKKCKLQFFDSDHEIELRTGVKITLIFEIEGEAGFRKRESQMINELTSNSGIVLATGGGAILDPENRKYLSERGFVIYLRASIEQLLRRTAKDQKRPLLQTDNPRAKIEELLAERGPLYEEIANMIVDTDGRTVQKIIDEICNHQDLK
ncbi:MAG: 3-dehydroquinate synthase [Gammaproteobacteria bacterium]|nr:3-dehydroquinate synthase [Gammaproteobacteria bacterium]